MAGKDEFRYEEPPTSDGARRVGVALAASAVPARRASRVDPLVRHQKRSTVLITNVDFDAWAAYLGDAPLAMAMVDRLVDGAIIIKIKGPSYRAKRSERTSA